MASKRTPFFKNFFKICYNFKMDLTKKHWKSLLYIWMHLSAIFFNFCNPLQKSELSSTSCNASRNKKMQDNPCHATLCNIPSTCLAAIVSQVAEKILQCNRASTEEDDGKEANLLRFHAKSLYSATKSCLCNILVNVPVLVGWSP